MIDRDFEVSMEAAVTCRKCGGACHPSKALLNLMCGTPDADGSLVGATLGMSKDVEMVGCLKCSVCGHSFALGK